MRSNTTLIYLKQILHGKFGNLTTALAFSSHLKRLRKSLLVTFSTKLEKYVDKEYIIVCICFENKIKLKFDFIFLR